MTRSYWSGKKVIVAGGAGMIGSHLAEQLVAQKATVRVVDNLESGSLANLLACRADVEFLQLDLRAAGVCRDVTAGMDAVFDLAAKTVGIDYSANHHGEMLCHTTMISMNMLEAARVNQVPRYLVTSSSCVYPDGSTIPTPESEGHLGTPEKANEGYGWAKRFAELQARYYVRDYGMNIAVVRPANVYGPRYNWHQQHAHVIPAVIFRMLSGKDPLLVWGSGNQTRSFVHAHDAATAMRLLVEAGSDGTPYNLGGQEITIANLVKQLAELAGYGGQIVFDMQHPEGPARKAQQAERLFAAIPHFNYSVPFKEGLRETVAAARDFLAPQGASSAIASAQAD